MAARAYLKVWFKDSSRAMENLVSEGKVGNTIIELLC